MKGYIIWDRSGTVQLTKNLWWYRRDRSDGPGYVFTPEQTQAIKAMSQDWSIPAYYKQAASYVDGVVTVLGELEPL